MTRQIMPSFPISIVILHIIGIIPPIIMGVPIIMGMGLIGMLLCMDIGLIGIIGAIMGNLLRRVGIRRA
jgi:hypothetical protein